MIIKLCSRCKRIIPYSFNYCDVCGKIIKEEKEKEKKKADNRYDKKREKKYQQFYNSKYWKILSRKKMQDKQYRCEDCGAIATQVHHIIPIQTLEGWNQRFDYENLKCQCVRCHNNKHQRFQKRQTY